jgi:hypothetical protein
MAEWKDEQVVKKAIAETFTLNGKFKILNISFLSSIWQKYSLRGLNAI